MEVKCLAPGHLNRLLDSSPDSAGSSWVWRTAKGTKKMYSRMLSVVSCTVSVLRRLSANIKAPISTVSRSRVAECSCSLVGSSLHAAWARGCSKLFTVSTIAWGSSRNTEVTWRKPILTHSSLSNAEMNQNEHKSIYCTRNIATPQLLKTAVIRDATVRMQRLFIYHVDKSRRQEMLAMQKSHSHADMTKAKTQKLWNKKLPNLQSTLWTFHYHLLFVFFPLPNLSLFKHVVMEKSLTDVMKIKLS